MRFGIPLDLPTCCDGCAPKNSLDHCLSCRHGGMIHGRYGENIKELSRLFALSIGQKNVQTESSIRPGSCVSLKCKNQDGQTTNPMEDRGDILLRGVYKMGQDVIVDFRVTNTDSVSYRGRSPEKVIESQEK